MVVIVLASFELPFSVMTWGSSKKNLQRNNVVIGMGIASLEGLCPMPPSRATPRKSDVSCLGGS